MIAVVEQRRQFLSKLCMTVAPMILLPEKLRAQADSQQSVPRTKPDPKSDDDDSPFPVGSRKAALEENEKNIKTKVEKLFQLASELKEEVEKTDSAKVLSLAMVKKAEEIEKLAKDIKTRAKG
jgi:hypothetical protein